jgi:hypothetical protein
LRRGRNNKTAFVSLEALAKGDPTAREQTGIFRDELRKLGWIAGRNVKYKYRNSKVVTLLAVA